MICSELSFNHISETEFDEDFMSSDDESNYNYEGLPLEEKLRLKVHYEEIAYKVMCNVPTQVEQFFNDRNIKPNK